MNDRIKIYYEDIIAYAFIILESNNQYTRFLFYDDIKIYADSIIKVLKEKGYNVSCIYNNDVLFYELSDYYKSILVYNKPGIMLVDDVNSEKLRKKFIGILPVAVLEAFSNEYCKKTLLDRVNYWYALLDESKNNMSDFGTESEEV